MQAPPHIDIFEGSLKLEEAEQISSPVSRRRSQSLVSSPFPQSPSGSRGELPVTTSSGSLQGIRQRRPSTVPFGRGSPAPSCSDNSFNELPTPTAVLGKLPRAHRLPSLRATSAASPAPWAPTGSEPPTAVASPLNSAPPTAPVTPRSHSLEPPASLDLIPSLPLGKPEAVTDRAEEFHSVEKSLSPDLPQSEPSPAASSTGDDSIVSVHIVAKVLCILSMMVFLFNTPMFVRFIAISLITATSSFLSSFGFRAGLPHDEALLEKHGKGIPERGTDYWANLDQSIPRVIVPFQHSRVGTSLSWPGARFSSYCMEIFWRNRVGPLGTLTFLLIGFAICFSEHATGLPSPVFAIALGCGGALSFLWQNTIHWMDHVQQQEEHERVRSAAQQGEIEPFLSREISVEKHAHRKNVRVWLPTSVSVKTAVTRGMGFLGMPLLRYLWDLLTYAVEYKIHKFFIMAMTDLGLNPGAPMTGENIYRAIVNGSYACWIDADQQRLVLYDSILPHNNTDVKWYYKIELDLDFDKKTVGEMRLEPYVSHTELLKLLVPGESEENDIGAREQDGGAAIIQVTSTRNLSEISAIIGTLGLYKNHPTVHHWANAVGELSPDEWCSAEDSHFCTQGLNNAAVFSTPVGNGVETSSDWAGLILAQNVASEGVPVHSRLGPIASKDSLVHIMSNKCRTALRSVLPEVNRFKREAIVMATVMHAADHHYVCKFLPFGGGSEILNHSSHLFWGAIAYPGRYYTRSFLCKERAHYDPVCKALYESCASVDKEFADNFLTIGILY